MTAAWMAVVLMTAAGPVSGALQVAIIAPRGMTDSLVRRICAEANDIWQRAGVALECHRIRSTQEASSWPLIVTIDEQEARRPDGALGWIRFTADGPERSIHLSHANAEDLIRRTPRLSNAAVASHEILVGRVLGRALAHEMGHYLLRTKVHTVSGLMRAAPPGDEFVDLRRYGFELTPDQSSAAARSRAEATSEYSQPRW